VIIDQSSQETEFPAINTIEDTKEYFWRTTVVDDPVYISSDLGAAYEINFVSILGHNFQSGATIKAIGADDLNFTTGIVEETIGYASTNIYHFFSVWQTKRYWKIQVNDVGNPDGYIEIATIILGKYLQLNCNHKFGHRKGREDFSILDYSDSMVLHAEEKSVLFVGDYEFGSLDVDSKDGIFLLLAECGKYKGFVVCFDPENADSNSYWAKLTRIVRPINFTMITWQWLMSIIEVK